MLRVAAGASEEFRFHASSGLARRPHFAPEARIAVGRFSLPDSPRPLLLWRDGGEVFQETSRVLIE